MKKVFYFLLVLVLISCGKEEFKNKNIEKSNDAIIEKRIIPLDLNNKILFKKSVSYTLVVEKDTSDYELLVSQG